MKLGCCRLPSSIRGSVLIFTLLVAVVLFILGCGFLSLVERDNRFAGYQERSERAWHLAQSGWEYYLSCSATLKVSGSTTAAIEPPRLLARVNVPAGNAQQYFELRDMGQGKLLCRGVVAGTLSGVNRQTQYVQRDYVVPLNDRERAYDGTLSF